MILYNIKGTSMPIISTASRALYAQNNVFTIILCVFFVLLFKQLKFRNRFINVISAGTFAVYLLHGDYHTMNTMFKDWLKMGDLFKYDYWIVLYILYIVFIYLACALIDLGKRKLLDRPEKFILDKIKIFNFEIEAKKEAKQQ